MKACLLFVLALPCLAGDPPPGLERWLVGDPADARVEPQGPAVILMGGGQDVDAAFTWWVPKLNGGDVVVLRVSGADGYNRYLHAGVGGCDSVETLKVTSRALADSAYVAERVAQAEGIWIAGGDQSRYVELWRGTKLQEALALALKRGAVVGGTSAGCALLGGVVFSAQRGTIRSAGALADPFAERVTLEPALVPFAPLQGVLTDTHFSQRERLGRLVAFLARAQTPEWTQPPGAAARLPASLGVGVDERTALAIDAKGQALVLGHGGVSLVWIRGGRARAGQPLACDVEVVRLAVGDRVTLPGGAGHGHAPALWR
ncbi:MAG: cyanophycinase, partial [Planctomycetes bacterium]|nr:cyanophycinase [Planctomycetota bacterium]